MKTDIFEKILSFPSNFILIKDEACGGFMTLIGEHWNVDILDGS